MPIKPGLKRDSYKIYLRSDHWKDIARRTREYYHFVCVNCRRHAAYGKGDVHHLTYENIGHERVGIDTVFLCRSCHQGVTKGLIKLTDTNPVARKKKQKMRGCGGLWSWRDYNRHVKKNPPQRVLSGTATGMPGNGHDDSERVMETGGRDQRQQVPAVTDTST